MLAQHAVIATGYEPGKLVDPGRFTKSSTWAMATAPQPDRLWRSRCLFWETVNPYMYMRTTLDGRIVVGGEDGSVADEANRDALIPKKTAAIGAILGAFSRPEAQREPSP
ncbi:MAG: FAD-dependent oxidoreductase [Geminicoccaceae bacterium]